MFNDKHAYLILAHGNYRELETLIDMIDDKRNDIYIHIDLHVKNVPFDQIAKYAKKSNLFFTRRIRVSWGGFSVIKAELILFENASSKRQYQYYHLMSGLDLPVKSQDYIHKYMNERYGENFIQPVKYDSRVNISIRYQQYHFLQDALIGKKRNFWKYLDFLSCYIQKAVGISRNKKLNVIPSIQWVSLTHDAVCYILSKRDYIFKQYRWSYCCDEIFLLTTLSDSDLYETISDNGNLRYIEWKWFSKHDNSPKVLTLEDYTTLCDPNILFARKFLSDESKEIIAKLPTDKSLIGDKHAK